MTNFISLTLLITSIVILYACIYFYAVLVYKMSHCFVYIVSLVHILLGGHMEFVFGRSSVWVSTQYLPLAACIDPAI